MVGSAVPDGFADYVAARQRHLLTGAFLLTQDWARAEDLVQTALGQVFTRWDRVARAGDPDAYVRRVVVNAFLSDRRRRWSRESPVADPPDAPGVYDAYAAADLRLVVDELLEQLPRRQRAAIVLRYFDDLSETQTADLLGCSVGTIRSQTARALAHLRALASDPAAGPSTSSGGRREH